MDFNEYQEKAARTSNTKDNENKIINAALGLAGESGEVADIVKKYKYQGHQLEAGDILEELGDILWYIAEMADGLEVDLQDIAEKNIAKLQIRYPDKFETEKSRDRTSTNDKIEKLF